MEKNVHESSSSFPPSPQSSPILDIPSEPNVPKSPEPNEQMEPQPSVVAIVNGVEGVEPSSKEEANPTMEFPIPSSDNLQEREDFPKPVILIVPAGMDVVNTILEFARDRDVNILVHHASGVISEVHISNPLSHANDYTFQGNMHMFYLSGVYTKCLSPLPPNNTPFSFFNIQFSRGEAPEVYGGLVGHKLIAAETVQVTASLFKGHEYYEYHEVVSPFTYPDVQPDIETDDLDDTTTTNNTVDQPCFP
ncbi:unnamed protein product [Sphenostylis stenocarpa]|uniref:PPC domain-containing protein n=1 Tax=Sphenostylis stenocarpa TaxID=92480 RepID=A0AA86SRL0_9FABA|nr:unnamed protein product [Sphenostylis stenocarpa]